MSLGITNYKDEPKTRIKKHFHFCLKCWDKWKCEEIYRKKCLLRDGIYCDKCLKREPIKNGVKTNG